MTLIKCLFTSSNFSNVMAFHKVRVRNDHLRYRPPVRLRADDWARFTQPFVPSGSIKWVLSLLGNLTLGVPH